MVTAFYLNRRSADRLLTAPASRHIENLQDTWIALDAHARRVNWMWTGLLTLMFAFMYVGTYLPPRSSDQPPMSAAERWWWLAVIAGAWFAACIYMVNRGHGRTELSADGMRFHSFFSRRYIPWEQITEVEKVSHASRGGPWWEVRVHLADGKKRHVPGAFTFNSRKKWVRTLDQKLETIRRYWEGAGVSDREGS